MELSQQGANKPCCGGSFFAAWEDGCTADVTVDVFG